MQASPERARRDNNGLRQRIDERADQLGAQLGRLEQQNEAIRDQVAGVRQELDRRATEIQESLGRIGRSQEALRAQANQLQADLGRLRQDVGAPVAGAVQGMRVELGAQITGVEQRMRAELQELRNEVLRIVEGRQTDGEGGPLFGDLIGNPDTRKCLEWLACRRPLRFCYQHCNHGQV